MPGPFAEMRPAFPVMRRMLGVAVLGGLTLLPAAQADPATEKVRGFFCNAKTDQVAFLTLQAQGENEEIAANAVNKSLAKFSCAYYIPATAVHTGDHTVMDGGLVFKLQSYLFLPEKVERWTGSVLGAMPQQDAIDLAWLTPEEACAEQVQVEMNGGQGVLLRQAMAHVGRLP